MFCSYSMWPKVCHIPDMAN